MLLSDLSGVPINRIDANVWSPFRDYGFGPGREGLLPPGSRVDPGNTPLELVELNLVSMDASGLTPQPLGTVTLTPDTPLTSVLQMPADIGPADTLILEAHSSWGLNANTSIEILQFRAIFVPCPWDCELVPDGQVSITDFLALLGQWNQVDSFCDFDGGGVGIIDFLGLLANWGACP